MQQDDVHACSQVQVLTTELIQVLENQLTNFSSSDWSKQKLLSSKPFQYTAAKLQIIQVLQLFFLLLEKTGRTFSAARIIGVAYSPESLCSLQEKKGSVHASMLACFVHHLAPPFALSLFFAQIIISKRWVLFHETSCNLFRAVLS